MLIPLRTEVLLHTVVTSECGWKYLSVILMCLLREKKEHVNENFSNKVVLNEVFFT